jgi:hypothetical protein
MGDDDGGGRESGRESRKRRAKGKCGVGNLPLNKIVWGEHGRMTEWRDGGDGGQGASKKLLRGADARDGDGKGVGATIVGSSTPFK